MSHKGERQTLSPPRDVSAPAQYYRGPPQAMAPPPSYYPAPTANYYSPAPPPPQLPANLVTQQHLGHFAYAVIQMMLNASVWAEAVAKDDTGRLTPTGWLPHIIGKPEMVPFVYTMTQAGVWQNPIQLQADHLYVSDVLGESTQHASTSPRAEKQPRRRRNTVPPFELSNNPGTMKTLDELATRVFTKQLIENAKPVAERIICVRSTTLNRNFGYVIDLDKAMDMLYATSSPETRAAAEASTLKAFKVLFGKNATNFSFVVSDKETLENENTKKAAQKLLDVWRTMVGKSDAKPPRKGLLFLREKAVIEPHLKNAYALVKDNFQLEPRQQAREVHSPVGSKRTRGDAPTSQAKRERPTTTGASPRPTHRLEEDEDINDEGQSGSEDGGDNDYNSGDDENMQSGDEEEDRRPSAPPPRGYKGLVASKAPGKPPMVKS